MGPWGYVFLAYGAAWAVLILYLSILKLRLRKAKRELDILQNNR